MKYLVTSALPYINGIKHIGNLIGSMLPADVYARYLRMMHEDVLYICATDEHGTPAEIAAKKLNMPVEKYCEEQHKIQKEIYRQFNLSFDHFGKTSSQQNKELTQYFAKKLEENGFIEKREITQIYSLDDEMFLPDRYVEGICPYCKSDKARGDQCDGCSRLLDPIELLEPKSSISGSKNLEKRKTSHLFILQSKIINEIEEWINEQNDWSDFVKNSAKGYVKQGIQDRCITRDLKWGVPVLNHDDLKNKVFYVWFDAPIGYIAATKEWSDLDPKNRDWKSYWYNTKNNIHYVQFMAKDNIPFHAVTFPATLFGTREPWKMVDNIKGMSWLNFYGDKFSTSRKNGIFMDEALRLYQSDYWRYYLMKNIPESSDFSFTWESFKETINSDLADVLGNYINRVLTLIEPNINSILNNEDSIAKKLKTNAIVTKFQNNIKQSIDSYFENLKTLKFKQAMVDLRQSFVFGNEFIAESKPWTLKKNINKENQELLEEILYTGLNFIILYSIIIEPIIPDTAKKLQESLSINDKTFYNLQNNIKNAQYFNNINNQIKINKLGILFEKIVD